MVVAKIKNKQCMKKCFVMGMWFGFVLLFLKIQIAIGIENKNEKNKTFICYPFFDLYLKNVVFTKNQNQHI